MTFERGNAPQRPPGGRDPEGAPARTRELGPVPGPQPGDRIGPYRLVRLVGQGSTGRVFEAVHERVGRRAALKILHPEQAQRPESVRRLFYEALAVNRINNPHIVEVTDLVDRPEGVGGGAGGAGDAPRPYAIVMELLDGQSLAELMAREAPLPPERFLPILAQVCEGLAAAHAAGFIHRDLKPDNIFLVRRHDGREFVKLLDFGLAKRVTVSVDDSIAQQLGLATQDGAFLGTPAYVSPEQAAGRTIDHRTDLYSVGVILYELIAGRLPFSGGSLGDFLLQHLTRAPAPLPSEVGSTPLGRTLAAVSLRCMAKEPDDRFSSAAELAQIFSTLATGASVELTSIRAYAWPSARRTLSRRAVTVGAGLAAGMVLWLAVHAMRGAWASRRTADDGASFIGGPGAAGVGSAGSAGSGSRARTAAATHTGAEPRAATHASAEGPMRAGRAEPEPSTAAGPAGDAPEDPRADWVTVTFRSSPPGAVVRRLPDGELIGITPFRQSFTETEHPLALEVRRAGYRRAIVRVTPARSQVVEVALDRSDSGSGRRMSSSPATQPEQGTSGTTSARASSSAEARRAPRRERDGTINPFGSFSR